MNKGFTLIEVLVAIVITTFVVGSAYTLFNSGVVFSNKHSTQVDVRNDVRHLFNEIVKMVQETDPNEFGSYATYVEKGFLTEEMISSLVANANTVVSKEISFEDGSDVVRYWYNEADKTIYKKKNDNANQVFLRNVDAFAITFNKEHEKLDYTIEAEIQYKGESVNISVQAVPRIPFRYADSILIVGSSSVLIPEQEGESYVYTYTAIAYDQFRSNIGTDFVIPPTYNGVNFNKLPTGELRIEVTSDAAPGTLTITTNSIDDGIDGHPISASYQINIVQEDTSEPPPTGMFNHKDANGNDIQWKSQGNNNQWNVYYSADNSYITISQKTNSNHYTIYDHVFGNFQYEVNVNLTGKNNTKHISIYGISFGGSNDVNKNKFDNNFYYIQMNGNGHMELRYKPVNGTVVLLRSLGPYNDQSLVANMRVVLDGSTLRLMYNGEVVFTNSNYQLTENYLGIGEDSKNKAPQSVYTVKNN